MKKFLLFGVVVASTISISAQVLESDNYNAYTLGNVATDATGVTPGQGGMFINAAASNFQIVNMAGAHANYLQVNTGATATAASNRIVTKNGLDTAWDNRTAGNNIIKGSVDIYTGTATGTNVSGVAIFGEDVDGNSVGIVGIRYNSSTKTINGLAYLTNGSTPGFYNITGVTSNTYPINTWVTVGYSYNTVSGQITYTIGGTQLTLTVAGYTTPAGLIPTEHSVYSSYGTGNNAATTFGIDNYKVEASNNSVLAVTELEVVNKDNISLYPNPVTDILNIKSTSKINNIEVYDMGGKKVNSGLNNNTVDVRSLNTGSYIINIETKDGKTSKKFIKK